LLELAIGERCGDDGKVDTHHAQSFILNQE
jgi:hypothetical protein